MERRVKMADVVENLDIRRIPEPKERDFERMKKDWGTLKGLVAMGEWTSNPTA